MTADPSRAPDRPAAWHVVTAQGVILAGPFARRETAEVAYDDTVTAMRREMERTRRPEAEIVTQVAAVIVAYGSAAGAWGGFEKVEEPR